MWPAWQTPPKYVSTELCLHAGWQVRSGALLLFQSHYTADVRRWLEIYRYVRVASNLYERTEQCLSH